ncbi:transmembrane protein 107-like isoform X1 [Anneissia japonica]|uniref:transmembrane protein 107-like isoform X1 n=1 Tax=Anneissia japonica TaxID=1529436 RepID=UPI001425BA02|nr:transmembrane protein 107-like isoform X1 [Anneissia japonica]
MTVTNIVPARFLCLISHLVVAITILWARDANVIASIPADYTQDEYDDKDVSLIVGLVFTLFFIGLELVGFMSGVSMFSNFANLISVIAHASATVSLSYFLFEKWPIYRFWWIFSFCSVVPAFIEMVIIISVACLKRT